MKPDWHYLRYPLLVFVVALIIAIALCSYGNWYEQTVMDDYYAIERGFNTSKRQYEEANKNRSLYESYLSNYLSFAENGVIGEERRLDWIERLQELDKRLSLPALEYEIKPREAADLQALNNTNSRIKIYSSAMTLTAEVLHEEDFFWLLQGLRSGAKGFYRLNACDLNSQIGQSGPKFAPEHGNVQLKCELAWLTVMLENN